MGPFALVGVDAPEVPGGGGDAALGPKSVGVKLGPFAVGGAVGVPVDPPETSGGVAGGVAPVSVDVPVDAPASGEAVEGVDIPVGEPKPDVSVGVPVAAGVALGSAVGDPAPEPGIEGTGGESMLLFLPPMSGIIPLFILMDPGGGVLSQGGVSESIGIFIFMPDEPLCIFEPQEPSLQELPLVGGLALPVESEVVEDWPSLHAHRGKKLTTLRTELQPQ